MRNQINYARDGEIARLRLKEELSLQDIGNIAGISRERVRQILVFHLGSTGKPAKPKNAWDRNLDRELWKELAIMPRSEIAKQLGLGMSQVQIRLERLNLSPSARRKQDMAQGYSRCGGYTVHVRERRIPCCEKRLPLSQFHPDSSRPSGYSCYCRDCFNKYQREHKRAQKKQ